MILASVENKDSERRRTLESLGKKKERAETLSKQLDDARLKVTNEKQDVTSKERKAESMETILADRERDLSAAERGIETLRKAMYRDSQRLAQLRKQEFELIADIKGTQAQIKNFSSKVNELTTKRAQREQQVSSADFHLNQMQDKVDRGLGVRSTEEQSQLQAQIQALETQLAAEKDKKTLHIQQQRKLNAELRAWGRKHELAGVKYRETLDKIDSIGMDIHACEQTLQDLVAKREDAMVSHDVTLLDVRRLRDSLRDLLQTVYSLKDEHGQALANMREKKDELVRSNDAKQSRFRSARDERHKSAVELGKLKVALDKTKAKHDMISSANAGRGLGEGGESPELKLILAAQKREELHQQGDKLDQTIQRKEREIKTMKKTLLQLREQNTSFRSSFHQADMKGAKATQLSLLEQKALACEEALFATRKEQVLLQRALDGDKRRLEELTTAAKGALQRNDELASASDKFEQEGNLERAKIEEGRNKVIQYQKSTSRKALAEMQQVCGPTVGHAPQLISCFSRNPELQEEV